MIYRCFILILLVCNFGWVYAQPKFANSTDSLIFNQADKAFALAFKNTDSALLVANYALDQAKLQKNNLAIANSWNAIGWIMMHKGNLDSAIICIQKAQDLFIAEKSEDDIVRVSINQAEVYIKQNKISQAIQLLMQADSICTKTGNLAYHTNVKRQLGIVYRESGDYKKALEYLREAMYGFEKMGDYSRYVGTGTSISILYRSLKMMDSSLVVTQRCLAIAKEKVKTPYHIAILEEHVAESYYGLQNYPEALKHYQTAYKIFESMNNKADMAFEAFSVGKTLSMLNQNADAEKYLLKSYAINDTLKMLNYQYDASQELASLYQKTGNWQKAFTYLKKAGTLKDSIGLSEQRQKTNELKEKFETEKKEQEIALLKTRNALTEADGRRTKLLQYIFLILFTASIAIGWLLLNRFRMRKKLDAQLLRNQIASDLHDDIGSALSSIDISSRIALVKQEDKQAVTEHLKKIQQYSRSTMESMSDIVWSINPCNDNFESVLTRMRQFAAELCEPLDINLKVNVPQEVENISFDSDKRKYIFLIFKEAVNNAVKYSSCTSLYIDGKKSDHHFDMRISDNGKGFDQQKVKTGNGLQNMKARADHLNAQISIQSQPGHGTTIALSCPL